MQVAVIIHKLVEAGGGVLVGQITTRLLHDLLDFVEAEIKLLNEIQERQADAVHAYFRVGRRWLEDADKVTQLHNRDIAIRHAMEQFRLVSELKQVPG